MIATAELAPDRWQRRASEITGELDRQLAGPVDLGCPAGGDQLLDREAEPVGDGHLDFGDRRWLRGMTSRERSARARPAAARPALRRERGHRIEELSGQPP